ncbi:type II toxin-antitoxin system tRNA(fMet)-specific endonuclease VapC [Breznakiella homolactica]|uniref:Ribonuclease VapC n=1 Tax=Breznakiella homolactica TaxID=2798577 RepID=A0A7T8B8N9_9SPIR|nr:type II toxin-antitoxin system VapC family toxin [Breznakiella homolactica]QQO07577.1 type II toxin-antitoxin system VapC family toxin [Breznakiella homolactica]
MYLLDTNICLYLIKERPEAVLKNLRKKRSKGIAISSITLAELEYGVENSKFPEKNKIALIKFLSIITILPFEAKAAEAYGKIKADLKRRGRIIGPLDILIAAHAKSEDLVLVTNNTREFERIADVKIENWM